MFIETYDQRRVPENPSIAIKNPLSSATDGGIMAMSIAESYSCFTGRGKKAIGCTSDIPVVKKSWLCMYDYPNPGKPSANLFHKTWDIATAYVPGASANEITPPTAAMLKAGAPWHTCNTRCIKADGSVIAVNDVFALDYDVLMKPAFYTYPDFVEHLVKQTPSSILYDFGHSKTCDALNGTLLGIKAVRNLLDPSDTKE